MKMQQVIIAIRNRIFVAEAASLIENLRRHGVAVLQDFAEAPPSDTLLLTDDAKVYEKGKSSGMASLICLTNENRIDDFAGAVYFTEGLQEIDYAYLLRVYERVNGIAHTVCETARLRIREIRTNDIDDIYRLYEDTDSVAYMERPQPNREEEEAYLARYIATVYAYSDYGSWVVEEKASGAIVGRVTLNYCEGFAGLELGYLIHASYRKRGYATEACNALVSYARKRGEFMRIRITTHCENEAAIALARRLGFTEADEIWERDKKYLCFMLIFR